MGKRAAVWVALGPALKTHNGGLPLLVLVLEMLRIGTHFPVEDIGSYHETSLPDDAAAGKAVGACRPRLSGCVVFFGPQHLDFQEAKREEHHDRN